MIDGKNVFDQPVKNDIRTYDSIRKIETGEGDACKTKYLLYSVFFKNYHIQQINFTGNLDQTGDTKIFFIIE